MSIIKTEPLDDKIKTEPEDIEIEYNDLSDYQHYADIKIEEIAKPKENLKEFKRDGLYLCPLCVMDGHKERINIESHILREHSHVENALSYIRRQIFSCGLCSYRTVYRKNFTRHLGVHDAKSLKKSMRMSGDQRSSEAEIRTALNITHMHCYHCDYKTKDKGSLVKHVRLHKPQNQRPFMCYSCKVAGCTMRFNEKNGLDSHIVKKHLHDKEMLKLVTNVIYQCPKCSYADVRKSKVSRHAKIHA